MLQRGRVSRASREDLKFPVVDVDLARLAPPSWLSRDEKKVFAEIVGACRPKHFTPADESLLVSYVQATCLARALIKTARKDRAALSAWEKATRTQAVLATKLRLAPQSRFDRKTVAVGLPSMSVAPWEES
jgi:phage terminase small subunit